ncbi:sacsin N-terminal ATP-binding-like domain-containing protein [Thioalkalivibrio sp. ALE14]|uniref:sacsin N-terminal ATP-binding-like domain-containing protein n=1 Tax=Thioalkalivibrio sp. ALE14 TaxID=1158168 RepID=UPI000382A5E8|nr:hypothetical protein [Thioalkalivibrio sp. ALE14]
MVSKYPSRAAIHDLLQQHLEEHRRLPESARSRDLGAERSLVQDYSGRVVFELLQNALDRSRERILVLWNPETRCLEVANDGDPVSAHAGQTPRRSDFHALLSLHSSTKSAKESVGNKGVGFRSVFAAAPEAEVWSRLDDGSWWGLRMRHPSRLQPAPVVTWASPEVASFYTPELLETDTNGRFSDYQTVIRLVDVRPERASVLEETVHELMRVPLRFLEARAPHPADLSIRLESGDQMTEYRLTDRQREIAISESEKIAVSEAVQRDTGLELDEARVRVMACTVSGPDGYAQRHSGLYWSYLPTEQEAGFGVDVQADFYLSNSRRALALRPLTADEEESASDPAGWNRHLVRRAANLIVHDLWKRPELVLREDFWAFFPPESCRCEHLTFEVGRLLLNDDEALRDLIRRSFPENQYWSLQRYTDLFSALEGWASYAYRNPSCAGQQALYRWHEALLEIVERSAAPVLPIVQETGESAVDAPVPVARPMVRSKPGQRRGTADRIYLRRERGDPQALESLPPVVQNQGTYVTVFVPPGMQRDDTKFGLMEFSRPELLAQLQPGENAREHRQLLRAALKLASEEPSQGGVESVLTRALTTPGGPAWRLSLEPGTTLRRAAQNLRSLCLPTRGGWEPAAHVTRSDGGPWPRLDEAELASVIVDLTSDTHVENPPSLDVDRACRLFGVGVLPIDGNGGIPNWPDAPSEMLGRSIIQHWSRDLHPVFAASLGSTAREQLRGTRWIHDGTTEGSRIQLEAGVGEGAPYAPLDLWVQTQSGFRTQLLPRLTVARDHGIPDWLNDLGIENPTQTQSEERILRALGRLRASSRAKEDERGLGDLYRRLVEGAFRVEPSPEIPLLYRYVDRDGATRSLEWGQPGDNIWHDPGGADSSALSAFRDVRIWTFRGATKAKAEALGLVHFAPGPPEVKWEGETNSTLAARLREHIWEALPDALAAASTAREEFDEQDAIRNQSALEVQHYERVWVRWTFAGKSAERGRDDLGDVFLLPLPDGRRAICFDGHEPPLMECAGPLSELLCGSRAFVTFFRDGLYAWSQTRLKQHPGSSLARFRRDYNLSEAEIQQWRGRLQEARLDGPRRALWEERVLGVLRDYGEVKNGVVQPGMTVTPALWERSSPDGQPGVRDVDEDTLRRRLENALNDDSEFQRLVPLVDFHTTHRDRFLTTNRTPYIAAAAERRGRNSWTEALLEELNHLGQGITDLEEPAFQRLGFDADQALRLRFGLPLEGDLAPSRAAMDFAHGQIPITSLPKADGAPPLLRPFGGTPGMGAPRAAISDQAWMEKAHRQMSGGRRAEDAILNLAIRQANEWKERDPGGFHQAIEASLPLLGEPGAERYARLDEEGGLRAFLHVSEYLGDVGFDVLVPDEDAKTALLVEAKRVPTLNADVAFFLSESERRRALAYRDQKYPWRLWLVSTTGETLDVSALIENFQAHADDVRNLLQAGLRPGEWELVIQPGKTSTSSAQ